MFILQQASFLELADWVYDMTDALPQEFDPAYYSDCVLMMLGA